MPEYKAPDSTALRTFASTLHEKYSRSERSKLVNAIKEVTANLQGSNDPHADKIILGACFYALASIQAEYRYTSPDYSTTLFGFLGHGSTLSPLLKTGLNITPETSPSNQFKLVCLNHFFKFIKQHPLNAEEKEAKALTNEVKPILQQAVVSLCSEISTVLKKRPLLSSLREHLEKIPDEYKASSSGNRPHVKLIELLNQPEFKYLLDINTYPNIYGLLLFIMQDVNNEYWVRSADRGNSKLYSLCKAALNNPEVDTIPAVTKRSYYIKVQELIDRIRQDEKAVAQLEKNGMTRPIATLERMLTHLNTEIGACTAEPPSMLSRAAVYLTSKGLTAKICQTPLAKTTLSIGTAAIVSAMGSAVILPGGVLVATGALASETLPSVVGATFSFVLNQLAALIPFTASETIGLTFALTAAGFRGLLHLYSQTYAELPQNEQKPEDIEWVAALLDLDDDIFEEKNKNIVRNVIEPAELKKYDEQPPSSAPAVRAGPT